jgi:hypothetical protein
MHKYKYTYIHIRTHTRRWSKEGPLTMRKGEMSLVKARLANTGNTLKPSPTQSTGTSATKRVSE